MKMVMIRVHEHLFKENAKSKAKAPLGCFSEQLLKNLKLKIDALGCRLTVLRPMRPDRQLGQTV
jgi:hypothetical protein